MLNFLKRTLYLFTLIALVVGCGGSGSNDGADSNDDPGPVNDNAPLTGQFMDSMVSGLTYSTPSQSGITGEDGEFSYLAGETVSFAIGGLELGSAEGKPLLTPFDLVDDAEPVTGTSLLSRQIQSNLAFNRVINITVLLQTLDYDGVPDNGITLSSEIDDLFQGVDLNLYQRNKRFIDDRLLRQILRQANSQSLFNDHRQVMKPWWAMSHLYSSIDIQQPSVLIKEVTKLDGEVTRTTRFFYDEAGNQTRVEEDRDGDGAADIVYLELFDKHGNRIGSDIDSNADGVADGYMRRTLNNDGDEQEKTADYAAYYSFYNEQGMLSHQQEDHDLDGVVDTSVTYEYNDQGLLSRRTSHDETAAKSEGGIETAAKPDWVINFAYDDQGNEIYREEINGLLFSASGISSRVARTTYNPDGLKAVYSSVVDRGGEEEAGPTISYQYNDQGYLLRELTETGDGSITYITTILLDDLGRPVEYETTRQSDGLSYVIIRYYYDNDGNLERETFEKDGEVDEKIYTYEVTGSWIGVFDSSFSPSDPN